MRGRRTSGVWPTRSRIESAASIGGSGRPCRRYPRPGLICAGSTARRRSRRCNATSSRSSWTRRPKTCGRCSGTARPTVRNRRTSTTRIEILHPGDDDGNGLVRHCYFPVPKWLLSGGVGQSWEWLTEVKPFESWRYDAVGKPLWSRATGWTRLDRPRRRPHAGDVHRGVRGVQPDHARAVREDACTTASRATTTRSSPRSKAACGGTASARRARPKREAVDRPRCSSTARSCRAARRGPCSNAGRSAHRRPTRSPAACTTPAAAIRPRRSCPSAARGLGARRRRRPSTRLGPPPRWPRLDRYEGPEYERITVRTVAGLDVSHLRLDRPADRLPAARSGRLGRLTRAGTRARHAADENGDGPRRHRGGRRPASRRSRRWSPERLDCGQARSPRARADVDAPTQSPQFASLLADAMATGTDTSDPLSTRRRHDRDRRHWQPSMLSQLAYELRRGRDHRRGNRHEPRPRRSSSSNALRGTGQAVRVRRERADRRPEPEGVRLLRAHEVGRGPRRGRRSPTARPRSISTSATTATTMTVEQALHTPGALLFHFGHEPQRPRRHPGRRPRRDQPRRRRAHDRGPRARKYGTNVFDNAVRAATSTSPA